MSDSEEISIQPQPDSAIDLLADFAAGIARRYQIPVDRAARIVVRWAEAFDLHEHAEPEEIRESIRHNPLAIAMDISNVLDNERSLDIIENDNPVQIAGRVNASAYLFDDATPLNTLPQLAEIIHNFIQYIERDRDHLLRTGLPQACFLPSRWLHHQLGRLYDTRMTGSPWPNDDPRSGNAASDRTVHSAYTWIKVVTEPASPPEVVRSQIRRLLSRPEPEPSGLAGQQEPLTTSPGKDEETRIRSLVRVETCRSHGEADLLPIFAVDPREASRLEAMRARVLGLKLGILRRLHQAVLAGDPTRLWEHCRRLIEQAFLRDEVIFLLKKDFQYMNATFATDCRFANPKNMPGGLSNLLEVIAHVEKELTTRSLATVRARLEDRVGTENCDRFLLGLGAWDERYYRAIMSVKKKLADSILDEYLEHAAGDELFLRAYRQRARQFVDDELFELFSIPVTARSKHKDPLTLNAKDYLSHAIDQVERTGFLPPAECVVTQEDSRALIKTMRFYENTFKRIGTVWWVVYKGKLNSFSHLDGFAYIHMALAAPDKDLDPIVMHGKVTGSRQYEEERQRQIARSLDGAEEDLNASDEADETSRPRGTGRPNNVRTDDVQDPESIIDMMGYINILDNEIDSLKLEKSKAGMTRNRIDEIDATITAKKEETIRVAKELSGNSISGRRRQFPTPQSKASATVGNRIRDVYKLLQTEHKDLYDHLVESMEGGKTVRYKSSSIEWDLGSGTEA